MGGGLSCFSCCQLASTFLWMYAAWYYLSVMVCFVSIHAPIMVRLEPVWRGNAEVLHVNKKANM